MAFVPTTSFLGSRVTTRSNKCRANNVFKTARMTVTSQPPSPTSAGGAEEEPVFVTPQWKKVPLKKGESFNFVRFVKDDFEASSIFDGLTGKGVKVAVLDTGCDKDHPALVGRINTSESKNYFYGGDSNDWNDYGGHGTHVSGIIAAEKGNNIMFGIAPEAELVIKRCIPNRPIRADERRGSDIAQAIRDAADEGCNVINMSFGRASSNRGFFFDAVSETYYAIQYALSKGVVIVAAAGNEGRGTDLMGAPANNIGTPGAFGGLITVASHDDNGRRSFFSSYGGELDCMAPGEVVSTWNNGGYLAIQGTSMASPLVAGLCALLIEAGKRRSPDGMSRTMANLVFNRGFRARSPFEVREVIRFLCERPYEHSRYDGYGKLSNAYQVVKGEVTQDMS